MLSLRITDQDIEADSAYDMEFIALAAAYRLIEEEVSKEGVRTDSDSAKQVILDGHARLRNGDCSHRILLQSIIRAACTHDLPPVWVKSHAHKRKKDRNI